MSTDALVAPLLRVELFHGLSPLQITELARNAERIIFKPGQHITTAGSSGDAAFLIVAGAATWLDQAESNDPPEAIEIGSLIGEMAMLIEHEYGATIIATSTVRCLKLSRETMHALMIEDSRLAQHLTNKIAGRLQQTAQALRDIDLENATSFDTNFDIASTEAPTQSFPVATLQH